VPARLPLRGVPSGPILRPHRPIGVFIATAAINFPANGARITTEQFGDIVKRTFLREHPADIFSLQIA